ncbi:MAG: hypothetical protein ACFB14_21275 [Leptolyngbyaceae cyanobacterium]
MSEEPETAAARVSPTVSEELETAASEETETVLSDDASSDDESE